MNDLQRRLDEAARAPVLLVATDYDGTLAPIVDDPAAARPLRESLVALRLLASLAHTHVAVVSGRALRDLAGLVESPPGVHLVGSHGSEFDLDFADGLSPQLRTKRDRVVAELQAIAARLPGCTVEEKPTGGAFHYRRADTAQAGTIVAEVLAGPASKEGVHTRMGKMVVELSVVPTSKARALETLRARVGAATTIFFGDDVTDEEAFAALRGPDVAVKVGAGATVASHRIDDPHAVARALATLAERRSAWLTGTDAAVPIEDHALLSDRRVLALATPSARITWMCLPRLDGSAVFAELLGGPEAGFFAVGPKDGAAPTRQQYGTGDLVLTTEWPTMRVTDFLDCAGGQPERRAGRTDLVRRIEGRGRAVIEFAPRPDFGRVPAHLDARDGGLVVLDTLDPIVLSSPGVTWTVEGSERHHVARAEVDLDAGPVELELRCGSGRLGPPGTPVAARLEATRAYWSRWTDALALPPIATDLVRRSAIVLRGLCYGPSGAIAAAATTSLPEHVGGVRNWDYRFCWLRDAALSAAALVRLGSTSEAMAYLDWVLGVIDRCEAPERLHPLYGVNGEQLGPEAEISELAGYRGSRPVRVGNSAAQQVQLDVFGPVVDLAALLIERDAPLGPEHGRLVAAMVDAVARRWREPDHGIWEVRRPRRHHVHSKVMCWVTVDRAVRVRRHLHGDDRPDWVELRDAIAAEIVERGWHDGVGAFTGAYESDDIDAASLHVGLSGLLPPDDPRVLATVDAVASHLEHGPTVLRYRIDDGLPGAEGGFLICAAWLVEALAMAGRTDEARRRFDELCALAGPTGMLPEQYDAETGLGLGNTPQAYSHLGVIDCAVRLAANGVAQMAP